MNREILAHAENLLLIIDGADKRNGYLWFPKGRSNDEQNWFAEQGISQRMAIEEAREAIKAARDADEAPAVEAAPKPAQGEGLPERDPTRSNQQQGLYRKFDVRRTDGSDEPGGKHHGCEYFVLDTTHDPAAGPALAAYANAIEATHPDLAADMRKRYTTPTDGARDGGEAVAWQMRVDTHSGELGEWEGLTQERYDELAAIIGDRPSAVIGLTSYDNEKLIERADGWVTQIRKLYDRPQPRDGGGSDVDDAMVERAYLAAAKFVPKYGGERGDKERMRAALQAAAQARGE